ncbi:MAG: hypothetical protein DCC55_39645 [Chloroflexi bacterium]|nr:MAG: hypothetical protein DCC55_39645 [Chloroflexota bacterium]
MQCPQCTSEQIVKNGSIHNGKPKYKCKACGRQFVENPQWRPISDERKAQIEKLLRERISLAGIVRVTGVSARWLQSYVNELYAQQPRQAMVRSKKTAFDPAMG